MGKWNRLYNRLAKTNLGDLLGMPYNPENDEEFQLERLQRRIDDWLALMERSEEALAKKDFVKAGNLASWVSYELPMTEDAIFHQLRDRAKAVLSQMPSDYKQPPKVTTPEQPRMSARHASAKLKDAQRLFQVGHTLEANDIVAEIQDHKLYSVWGSHAINVQMLAIDLRKQINAKLLEGKKEIRTKYGVAYISDDINDPAEIERLRRIIEESHERKDGR